MPFENVGLYGIGAFLFLVAIATSYFMFSEVIQLLRDIVRNRMRAPDDYDEGSARPIRQIVPFRDRGTIERLIAYFTRRDRH